MMKFLKSIKSKLTKKKTVTLYKFNFFGFTESAKQIFDAALIDCLEYSDYDTEIVPGTFRYDYIDESFLVHFKSERDLREALSIVSHFDKNRDEYYKPVLQ